MKKKILISCFIMTLCLLLVGCGATPLNKTVEIKEDNIKITVLGFDTETIDEEMSAYNGDYIKVEVEIENTGKNSYRFNSFNYKLGGDFPATPRDEELSEVKPGEKKKGYIYFKKTDKTVMSYQKTGGKEYQFNIK